MNKELGWNDEIEKESDFILFPAGDYDFEVVGMERARHNGSEKLPPCNKAIVHLRIFDGMQDITIKHQLFLHTKTEGMLSAFFIGIGQKKHGEPLKMDWHNIIGQKGRCKIKIDKWTTGEGKIIESNKILKFYDPPVQKIFDTSSF